MKVCIDCQSVITSPAGVGRYTKELVKAMAELMHDSDITLYYFNFRKRFRGISGFPNKEIRCIPGRLYNKLWKWFHFPPINWFVGNFDVYHFPNFTLPPLKRGRSIITVHDLTFVRFPSYIEPKNLRFLQRELPRSLKGADKIIAVSQFTKQELVHFFRIPPEKISVIYEGVGENFRKVEDIKREYILFVGTLEPRKNIEGLIRAYYMCGLKDYKLVIAGGPGWLYSGIFKLTKELGLENKIVFLGYVKDDELVSIYNRAKLFVYPSFYEGFGLPPLEAMACGVPVVAGRVNEVLGNSAYFVDPKNPMDIAAGMKKVLEDERLQKDLIIRGMEHVKKYTWHKAAEETLALYRTFET